MIKVADSACINYAGTICYVILSKNKAISQKRQLQTYTCSVLVYSLIFCPYSLKTSLMFFDKMYLPKFDE